ncbi:MAG: DMT family transporter [Methylobacillus sp.]|jgi:drug/metabolite transporter (DMT)-like permease|nr:DMT family transporter [Methylobacillus sp.]
MSIVKNSATKHPSVATFGLLFGATVWGMIWYPYRLLEQAGVSGAHASFLTYAIALLIGLVIFARHWRELGRDPLTVLVLALAAGWCNLAYVLAVIDGEVVRIMLLFYLSPLWTLLLARILLHERAGKRGTLVIISSLCGAFIMLWEPAHGFPLPRSIAEWLALSSGAAFAVTNVLTRRATHLSLAQKSVAVWGGVAVLGLVFLLFSDQPVISISSGHWWLMLLMGVVLLVTTLLVQYGVTHTLATRAAVIFLFELVVATLFAWMMANETPSMRELIGGTMIVAATLFSAAPKNTQT